MKLATIILCLGLALSAKAVGTWQTLTHKTPGGSPNGDVSFMLLLSDGTVMVENDPTGGGGTNWFRLTPDSHGSYANGTWSLLAPMNYSRLDFASDIMTNGKVFVAGGEYGTGYATAEVYDPVSNVWNVVSVPTNLLLPTALSPIWGGGTLQGFSDSISQVLPDGNVLIAPVAVEYSHETMIYNPVSNLFTAGPNMRSSSQSEASWVRLPDESILTIDPFGQNSERYIPALNAWVADARVPAVVYSTNTGTTNNPATDELGPGFLLPNGQAIFFGATTNNVIYTPTGTTNPGTWTAVTPFPTIGTNAQAMPDAPGDMMNNGKILVCTGTADTYRGPIHFFEYDYISNTFTQTPGPPGNGTNADPYYTKLLQLPDGTVLWNYGNPQLYCYTPDGSPLAAGQPGISSIVGNADGSYHLTGHGLNGISAGAAYGDDAQMDTDYPLVRMTNSLGQVYYARTYGWTSTDVMTSNKVVSTEFALPSGLPGGTYSLVVVANGNASQPVLFTIPLTPPGIANYSLTAGSLTLNCTNGLAGRTYYLLTSASATPPLSQWTSLATNMLATNGNFTIGVTNVEIEAAAQGYFAVEAQ